MVEYEALRPHGERYIELEVTPLRVVLHLQPGSRLAGYDPINLDNLLARMVVDEATEGRGLPFTPEAYNLPVPLKCLWRSDAGLPLWAATPFTPAADCADDVAYWHKRVQTGRFTGTKSGKYTISSTNGRYMERRVPLPTKVCDIWQADCIGNAAEVARLLAGCTYVGKRRTNGFGEVAHWEVQPLDAFALVRDDRLTRPIPAMAIELLNGHVPEGQPAPIGWTPPQWKPSIFAPGWWTGTPVIMDWFAGAMALERQAH